MSEAQDYVNDEFISECCGSAISGDVIDGIGLCSHCGEWSGAVPERRTEEDEKST